MASEPVTPQGYNPLPLQSEQAFPSTTWAWKRVKIACPPEARGPQSPAGRRWRLLPRRNRRDPLPITIKYRGGAEDWVEIHARGSIGRYPGWVAIGDIVNEINGYL
jgi:hypothetical protein